MYLDIVKGWGGIACVLKGEFGASHLRTAVDILGFDGIQHPCCFAILQVFPSVLI